MSINYFEDDWNVILGVDSYKVSHNILLPEGLKALEDYAEARGGDFKYICFAGFIPMLRMLQGVQVTKEKIQEAKFLMSKHFGTDKVFDEKVWDIIVDKYEGKLPIEIWALPEGSVIEQKNVVFKVIPLADEFADLAAYLETILMRSWYSISVSTNSLHAADVARYYFNKTSDNYEGWKFLLHDFGSRGVTTREQAQIGGAMHLLSFSGTDNLDGLRWLIKHYDHENWTKRFSEDYTLKRGYSVCACYDKETEILTNKGWKYFCDLLQTDKVATYNENGDIIFEIPSKIHKYKFDGELIKFKKTKGYNYVDMLVTPNHRMIRTDMKENKLTVFEAGKDFDNIRYGYNNKNKYIISGKINNNNSIVLTDLERLKIAFQADGTFPSHKDDYTSNCIRFGFKKERKIKRLLKILSNLDFEYTQTKYENGYTSFWINCKDNVFSKYFDWINFDNISYDWCNDFINELQYWNGNVTHNTIIYSSSDKVNIDAVQAICAISNKKTKYNGYLDKRGNRKFIHTLNILRNKTTISGMNTGREKVQYNDDVYCVTVNSGMLVVRRNNIVVVSGNSEHMVMSIEGREGEKDVYRRILKKFSTGDLKDVIISLVSDTYDIYKTIDWLTSDPEMLSYIKSRNANNVIRPDSGDPFEVIIKMLDILTQNIGYTYNSKGYKVLNHNIKILQGDGINLNSYVALIRFLCDEHKWSIDNFVFGSGGGLLMTFNRDTTQFAIKCSHATYKDGTEIDVYKDPITGSGKKSKKGKLWSFKIDGKFETYNEDEMKELGLTKEDSLLKPVFRMGEVLVTPSIEEVSERMIREFDAIDRDDILENKELHIEILQAEKDKEDMYYNMLFNINSPQKDLTASIVRRDFYIKEIEKINNL